MNHMNFEEIKVYMNAYMHNISVGQLVFMAVLSIVLGLAMILALRHSGEKIYWWKVVCVVCLSLVLSAICIATLTGRKPSTGANWMWQPFWSYKVVLEKKNVSLLAQIIWNILAFIPLGLLLPICFHFFSRYRYVFLNTLLISGMIEMIQGVKKIGLFELDDIMNNLLGSAIGVGIYAILKKLCVLIRGSIKEDIK